MSPDSACNDPVSLRAWLRGEGSQGAAELPRRALPACILACSCLPGHTLPRAPSRWHHTLSGVRSHSLCFAPLPPPQQGDG